MSATGAKLGALGVQALTHQRFGGAALHQRIRVLERRRRDRLGGIARMQAGDVGGRSAHVGVAILRSAPGAARRSARAPCRCISSSARDAIARRGGGAARQLLELAPNDAPIDAFTFSIASQPQLESGCGCRTTARMPVMSGCAGFAPVQVTL